MNTTTNKNKIDVLFIHCGLAYSADFSSVNMGLIYMATCLQEKGYRVEILSFQDYYRSPISHTAMLINDMQPALVGFYAISDNISLVEYMAQNVRKWLPSCKMAVGGPLTSALGKNISEKVSFDYICTGEGEDTIIALCDHIIRGEKTLDKAPGLICMEKGKPVLENPPVPIEDLDRLPYPDHRFFAGQQVLTVVTGRGCPYQCAFCFQAGHGLHFRLRSAENILNELTMALDNLPIVGFSIADDAFIVDPSRCLDIAEGLVKYRETSHRDFIFFCQGRVNILDKHPELIPALARAGMARMQIGIESGDDETLKIYRKQITTDQVRKTVQMAWENRNFMLVGGFIVGGPFESEKTFEKTVSLAEELIESAPGIFETSVGFLGAYPGTEIAGDPARFGLKIEEPDFIKGESLSDFQMSTEYMDRWAVRALENRFYIRVLERMKKNLTRIPPSLIRKHFHWASRYQIFSSWYNHFLFKLPAPKNYFSTLRFQDFREYSEILRGEIENWIPFRVLEKRFHNADGSLSLPESIDGIKVLTDQDEILVYELSSGKLKLKDAVKRFCIEKGLEEDSYSEVLNNIFLPLYKRLEKSYHVLFYQ